MRGDGDDVTSNNNRRDTPITCNFLVDDTTELPDDGDDIAEIDVKKECRTAAATMANMGPFSELL